jgi:hypothetical protein
MRRKASSQRTTTSRQIPRLNVIQDGAKIECCTVYRLGNVTLGPEMDEFHTQSVRAIGILGTTEKELCSVSQLGGTTCDARLDEPPARASRCSSLHDSASSQTPRKIAKMHMGVLQSFARISL